MTGINRRYLLMGAAGVSAAGAIALYPRGEPNQILISAADRSDGQHCLLGQELGGANRFCIPVPQRAHQAIAHPSQPLALFFGRRPSSLIYIVDTEKGDLIHTIHAPQGRHFYGHGAFNLAADTLFCSENDYHNKRGRISAYSVNSWQRLGSFSSGGLGPHQIERLAHSNILAVANGGLETHPDHGREILNLATMEPNLSYLDLDTQRVLQTVVPPHHQMSTRHLALTHDGRVILGVQDQLVNPQSVRPLVYSHRRGQALQALDTAPEAWLSMQQYIASVAAAGDGRWALTTTPRGNLITLWNLDTQCAEAHHRVRDVAGALWNEAQQRFILSSGIGGCFAIDPNHAQQLARVDSTLELRWDNHLNLISNRV